MSVLTKTRESILTDTLTALLNELGEECQNVLRLLAQLQMPGINSEQIEDILAELTGAVAHLHAHTDGLQDLISDELEKL